MSTARAEILARTRAALGAPTTGQTGPAGPVGPVTAAGELPRGYLAADDPWETGLPRPELLALLERRVVDYRATFTVASAADLPAVVARLLDGAARVVVPAGLDPTWLTRAEDAGAVVLVDDAPGLSVAELDAADAVVTASRLAIAETGTIVLDAAPDQGRRAISLLPDHHVCVVRADAVVRGLPAAIGRLATTRPMTWISGPSATSDIELSRVDGVHGPRRLDVVLLQEQ
ncbi:lactate utilization protein C [Cellulomonas sp. KRMCY2]|uniref:LutC/YkgG family protein n=1 Tax=Cellulomonas sp. KRMCY2 TaxID=1304865 RepID=UPI00045E5A71|nr:lactate utilization protein C [Cellulomonas sp. KRMCY2]